MKNLHTTPLEQILTTHKKLDPKAYYNMHYKNNKIQLMMLKTIYTGRSSMNLEYNFYHIIDMPKLAHGKDFKLMD
jgi:hypothetical protein